MNIYIKNELKAYIAQKEKKKRLAVALPSHSSQLDLFILAIFNHIGLMLFVGIYMETDGNSSWCSHTNLTFTLTLPLVCAAKNKCI